MIQYLLAINLFPYLFLLIVYLEQMSFPGMCPDLCIYEAEAVQLTVVINNEERK